MSEPVLIAQEPGALPTVDLPTVDSLASGNVGELVEALPGLDDDALATLLSAEQAGKARTTAIAAITTEQARRVADAPRADDAEPAPPAIAGNISDYRHLPASKVDLDKINSRVLTRDGWVMPRHRAEAQG